MANAYLRTDSEGKKWFFFVFVYFIVSVFFLMRSFFIVFSSQTFEYFSIIYILYKTKDADSWCFPGNIKVEQDKKM